MIDFLINLLAFIVAISVLVAIHEYGHYIVGRWAGMKVLRFSIGFGTPIWTWVRGEDRTEYCISSLPLGGYVRFLDSREGAVAPEDEGRAFDHRPIPARIAVLFAGPLFNFLFAIVAYWALFVSGVPTVVPAVGEVTPGSYAAEAGLEFGDKIIAVGDTETADWEEALSGIIRQMVATSRVPLVLEDADGRQREATLQVTGDVSRLTEPEMLFEGLGFTPWQRPSVVGEVIDGGSADSAGIRAGDHIVAVDGVPVATFNKLVEVVNARPGKPVTIVVDRGYSTIEIDLVIGAEEFNGRTIGMIGVQSQSPADYYYMRKYGVLESVPNAVQRMWNQTVFTVSMLGRMIVGDVSVKNISGPINIAQFAGDSAQRGLEPFLRFLAMISISLGVLNLLPVPVLDGGHLLYFAIEAVKGSPLSEAAMLQGQKIGLVMLLGLMTLAFYVDILRILE